MFPPKNLSDCRTSEQILEDHKLANEFATKGSVQHFALRMGFMPYNEEDAEAILKRIILENEWRQSNEEI